jgi:hypothetical protein
MRYEVYTAQKAVNFWAMAMYIAVGGYEIFGKKYCLYFQVESDPNCESAGNTKSGMAKPFKRGEVSHVGKRKGSAGRVSGIRKLRKDLTFESQEAVKRHTGW